MAKKFECVCGDADYRFKFGKVYQERDIMSKMIQRTDHCIAGLFPGLVLKGPDGKQYVPDIKVGLKERT